MLVIFCLFGYEFVSAETQICLRNIKQIDISKTLNSYFKYGAHLWQQFHYSISISHQRKKKRNKEKRWCFSAICYWDSSVTPWIEYRWLFWCDLVLNFRSHFGQGYGLSWSCTILVCRCKPSRKPNVMLHKLHLNGLYFWCTLRSWNIDTKSLYCQALFDTKHWNVGWENFLIMVSYLHACFCLELLKNWHYNVDTNMIWMTGGISFDAQKVLVEMRRFLYKWEKNILFPIQEMEMNWPQLSFRPGSHCWEGLQPWLACTENPSMTTQRHVTSLTSLTWERRSGPTAVEPGNNTYIAWKRPERMYVFLYITCENIELVRRICKILLSLQQRNQFLTP